LIDDIIVNTIKQLATTLILLYMPVSLGLCITKLRRQPRIVFTFVLFLRLFQDFLC